jgi:hypothetical protein
MANRYWILNGGNWNDTAHWSASSGGVGGASIPISEDVYFDSNSFSIPGQTVIINTTAYSHHLNFTGVTNSPTLSLSTFSIVPTGSFYSSAANPVKITFTGAVGIYIIYFGYGVGSMTANFSGITLDKTVNWYNSIIILEAASALDTLTLLSDFEAPWVGLKNVNTGAYGIKSNGLTISSLYTNLGSGTHTIYSDYTVSSGITGIVRLNAGIFYYYTSKIYFSINGIIINSAGTYATLNEVEVKAGYNLSINSATDDVIIQKIKLNPGCKLTTTYSIVPILPRFYFKSFIADGTSGSHITVVSNVPGFQTYWNVTSSHASYCDVADINALGTGTPIYNLTGVDNGNNVGWLFVLPLQFNVGTAGKLYIAPPRGTMNNPIIDGSGITATRTYTLQNSSGTLAFLSDLTSFLTQVTADSPLTGLGTSANHLSIPAASGSVNGYLTMADWTTFSSVTSKMTNPMTTTGDIIFSTDNSGTPDRLPLYLNGMPNMLISYGAVAQTPYWEIAEYPLMFAVCNNDEVICNNDEIVFI